jgi:hypothetical protein
MSATKVGQSVIQTIVTGTPNIQVGQAIVQMIVLPGVAPLSIICNNPPQAAVGIPYSHAFPASGGTAPYTFSVSAGSLPPGITLDPATGIASGIPTSSATYNFTILVTDAMGSTASVSCSIASVISTPSTGAGAPHAMNPEKLCRKPNEYDCCLFLEEVKVRKICFPPLCSIPEEYRNLLPWDDTFGAVPEQAVPFRVAKGIATPTSAAGDQTILEMKVPVGYDGLLTGIFQIYTGPGFAQGSGDILWRLRIDQHFVKDLGASPYQLGSPQEPIPMTEGMVLWSGQTVRYLVNVPNLSGNIQSGSTLIVAGVFGFFWPR